MTDHRQKQDSPRRGPRRVKPVGLAAFGLAAALAVGVGTMSLFGSGAEESQAAPLGKAAFATQSASDGSTSSTSATTSKKKHKKKRKRHSPTATTTGTATPTSGTTPTATTTADPTDAGSTSTATTTATTSTSASASASTSVESDVEQQVVDLVNEERAAAGCSALTVDATLASVARAHSKDMAVNDYFSHESQDGTTPFQRMTAAGYSYSLAAENIAAGQQTAEAVMTSWMNSAGHKANILNCDLTEIGVGLYEQTGSTYGIYWTQDFGTPQD